MELRIRQGIGHWFIERHERLLNGNTYWLCIADGFKSESAAQAFVDQLNGTVAA